MLERYPQIIIVSTQKRNNKADIVDDHYYNMPEFLQKILIFMMTTAAKEFNIFVGEFAVNQTYEDSCARNLRSYVYGWFERNQDVVSFVLMLTIFSRYQSWYPNLIMFDNSRSYVQKATIVSNYLVQTR